ncbi:MAG: hypothetical protein AB1726_10025 [Planctomycetota bacterium]
MSRALIAFLVLAAAAPPGRSQTGYAEGVEAIEAARIAAARGAFAAETDPVLRQRGLARLHVVAGDPGGGVAEAARGLALAPADLRLLFWASQGSLWLASDELAERYTGELARAVEAAADLTAEERVAWQEQAERYRAQSRDLVLRRHAREAAVGRARLLSLAVLALLALALALLASGALPQPR